MRVKDGSVLIGPCRFTCLGFWTNATVALQLVVANYHGEDLRIEEEPGRGVTRSTDVLTDGVVRRTDIAMRNRRGNRLLLVAAVLALVWIIGVIIAPSTKHGSMQLIHEPYNAILDVFIYTCAAAVVIGGAWSWALYMLDGRKRNLFE